MKKVEHIIAMFFVTMILLFKVAGVHVLTHHVNDDDIQHCEVCHITTAASFTPILDVDSTVLPQPEYFFTEQKLNNCSKSVVFNNRHLSSYLYTRPPPKLF